MKLSPHWPSQHTKLGILWSGLNINLCHSRATADSQAHSRVFCGEFGTHLVKYFKPEGFYYRKPAGLWWPTCSHIQIDLTEFHQGKVIQEISLFLHLCVAGLSGPVDWHWLWGIVIINRFIRLSCPSGVLHWHWGTKSCAWIILIIPNQYQMQALPDSKVHWANMEPTWVLSAPDGPHVGHINLTIRAAYHNLEYCYCVHVIYCKNVIPWFLVLDNVSWSALPVRYSVIQRYLYWMKPQPRWT